MAVFNGILIEAYQGDVIHDRFLLLCTKSNLDLIKLSCDDSSELNSIDFEENEEHKSWDDISKIVDLKKSSLKMLLKNKSFGMTIIKMNNLEDLYKENRVISKEMFRKCFPQCSSSFVIDGYGMSYFYTTLKKSKEYRRHVLYHNLKLHKVTGCALKRLKIGHFLTMYINLITPEQEILDFAGNRRVTSSIVEWRDFNMVTKVRLLMLDPHTINLDEIGGRITVRQFKYAFQFGDPEIVMRCKLYVCVDLLIRGFLKEAKKLIIEEYKIAKFSADKNTYSMWRNASCRMKIMY